MHTMCSSTTFALRHTQISLSGILRHFRLPSRHLLLNTHDTNMEFLQLSRHLLLNTHDTNMEFLQLGGPLLDIFLFFSKTKIFHSHPCIRCDDRAKSSGWWLLGSPLSAVFRQLAPAAWCPLQCLLAKTVGVLSPGVGRSEECAQGFAPQSHIHGAAESARPILFRCFLSPQ